MSCPARRPVVPRAPNGCIPQSFGNSRGTSTSFHAYTADRVARRVRRVWCGKLRTQIYDKFSTDDNPLVEVTPDDLSKEMDDLEL